MKISRKDLQMVLTHLRPGRPIAIGGTGVQKIMDLYRIGDDPNLYTLEQVTRRLEALMVDDKPPEPEVPKTPVYPDDLRCLSIAGAYGWLIAKGYKSEEYRDWPIRGRMPFPVLLHVSTGKGYEESYRDYGITERDCPKSAIIGAAIVTGCVNHGGNYGHVMENPVLFDRPVKPVSGRLYYWKPKPSETEMIRAWNRAWSHLPKGWR